MNFLAHIYLSYNHPEIEIGNFIADSVKGNNYLEYPNRIKEGIILHRKIDTFTDTHPIIRSAKDYFSEYNHYAGVILDIVLDHFLAKNWSYFHDLPLLDFTHNFYNLLEHNWKYLPKRVQQFYPNMKSQNWLYMYQSIPGITDILYQMNRRTNNISKMNFSVIELRKFYTEIEESFFLFFKELEVFVKKEISTLSL